LRYSGLDPPHEALRKPDERLELRLEPDRSHGHLAVGADVDVVPIEQSLIE
jgi:hypothetical protein